MNSCPVTNTQLHCVQRFMMLDQLVIHESREESDPHWDMRLDIDDMSYEVVRKNLYNYYHKPAQDVFSN